jgi:uncharacterized SAM-binding protein YcdF (DUF218 family)
MQEVLQGEYGVPVRWTENLSRNTRENAVNAAAILNAEDKRRVLLVMHGFDVRRARALFERSGLANLNRAESG